MKLITAQRCASLRRCSKAGMPRAALPVSDQPEELAGVTA